MSLSRARANTAWNSCSWPVVKAPSDPTRYSRQERTNDSAEHVVYLRDGGLEPLQPVLQRLGIVQAQVLHIQNGEINRLEIRIIYPGLAGRRREDVALDPGIEGGGRLVAME